MISLPDRWRNRPAGRRSSRSAAPAGRGLPARNGCRSPATLTCRITVAEVSGISSEPAGRPPRSGSDNAIANIARAARHDRRTAMEGDPRARRRGRRIQPHRRLVVDQRQQHGGRRVAQWRRADATRDRMHLSGPRHRVQHGAESTTAHRRPDRRNRARVRRSLRPQVRIVRMAKNCTVSPPPSPRGPPCAPLAAPPAARSRGLRFLPRDHRILHQRIDQRGQFGPASLAPGDVGMTDKPVTRYAPCSASRSSRPD